jgi:Carboxypeptidase regulatory-like domain
MTRQMRIASPCTADWNQMQGNDRVRYCCSCQLNVYNFSAMTSSEIDRLVAQSEGRLCGRYYLRPDGTILTQNCPVGFRAIIWRSSRAAILILSVCMSLGTSFANAAPQQPKTQLTQIKPAARGLSISVVDVQGAAISRAEIVARDQVQGVEFKTQTDGRGEALFAEIPMGIYQVSVQAPGFSSLIRRDVRVSSATAISLRLDVAIIMGEIIAVPEHQSLIRKFFSKLKSLG